jgi:hypothetical protein
MAWPQPLSQHQRVALLGDAHVSVHDRRDLGTRGL